MIIDYIEAFDALEHHDIRVVRSKYVDSAEDAIAFAARRDAHDARTVAIGLRCATRSDSVPPMLVPSEVPLRDPAEIRASFGLLSAAAERSGDRIVATEFIGKGTDVEIVGRTDDFGRKYLALRRAEHGLERLVPLEQESAEVLAAHVFAHDHRGSSEKQRRMLEHLVVRVSVLFERREIQALKRVTVRLHDNMYTVLDATMLASTRLHFDKRLDRHAHDRKEYGFRPAGRR